jgi:ComF family protein
MYNRFYDAISEKCYELITYVPVSDNRFKERGYDQSREMAIALAEKLNIACIPLLINVSGNAKQSRLNRKGRFSGIKGRFELNDSFRGSINCKIIIIDDILTTGATLNECAGILMKNGAVSVDAMVFASGRSDLN